MIGYIVLARCTFDDVICGLYNTYEKAIKRGKEIIANPKLRHTCQPFCSDTEFLHVSICEIDDDYAKEIYILHREKNKKLTTDKMIEEIIETFDEVTIKRDNGMYIITTNTFTKTANNIDEVINKLFAKLKKNLTS